MKRTHNNNGWIYPIENGAGRMAEAGWLPPKMVATVRKHWVLCWIILSMIQLNLAMSPILRGQFVVVVVDIIII